MKIQFNRQYFFIFLGLLILETTIALWVRDQFIRPFFGDVLVVILMFSFVRIFYQPQTNTPLIIALFFFAVLIEIGQALNLVFLLHLQDSPILSTMLGKTFDWLDVLAYGLGCGLLLLFTHPKQFKIKSE